MVSTKEHFDRIAPSYLREGQARIHKHHARIKAQMLAAILVPTDRVLDVGCGVGEYLEQLDGRADLHGADLSKGMVRIAAGRTSAKMHVADTTALPFKDASFDVVYSVGLLHHLKTPDKVRAAMAEFARVSRREIIIFDLNPVNPFTRWIVVHLCPWDEGDERVPPKREVLEVARQLGLRLTSVEHRGFVPYFTPRRAMPLAERLERLLEKVPFFATSVIYRFRVA